jgi:hypothetical protein
MDDPEAGSGEQWPTPHVQQPPPYRPSNTDVGTAPGNRPIWGAPPTAQQSGGPTWPTNGSTTVETENARFTVQVVDPVRERRRRVALRVGAVLMLAAGVAIGARLGAAPVGRWIERTTATTTTTTAPDPCRDAFDRARSDPSQANRIATLTVCEEGQWTAEQESAPVPATVLRDLCAGRGGVPAPACVAVDAQLRAEALAAASAAPAPPPTTVPPRVIDVPQFNPVPTSPPTTVYYYPGGTYSYPSDNYGGRIPAQPPRNGYPSDPSGNYSGRIPGRQPGL